MKECLTQQYLVMKCHFERDGTLYEGFDGVTFKRVLYGEERPQELALVEP